jgi:Sec-independent protein translocase protein TatA
LGEFKRATDELRTNLDIDLNSNEVDYPPSNLTSSKKSKDENHDPQKEEKLSVKEKNIDD